MSLVNITERIVSYGELLKLTDDRLFNSEGSIFGNIYFDISMALFRAAVIPDDAPEKAAFLYWESLSCDFVRAAPKSGLWDLSESIWCSRNKVPMIKAQYSSQDIVQFKEFIAIQDRELSYLHVRLHVKKIANCPFVGEISYPVALIEFFAPEGFYDRKDAQF